MQDTFKLALQFTLRWEGDYSFDKIDPGGETKFGMERFINGFLDLITIWFLSRFGKRPMHLE